MTSGKNHTQFSVLYFQKTWKLQRKLLIFPQNQMSGIASTFLCYRSLFPCRSKGSRPDINKSFECRFCEYTILLCIFFFHFVWNSVMLVFLGAIDVPRVYVKTLTHIPKEMRLQLGYTVGFGFWKHNTTAVGFDFGGWVWFFMI